MKNLITTMGNVSFLPAAATTATPEIQNILDTIMTIVSYVQLLGGGVIVLCVALAAIPFLRGGQQNFEVGKAKIIGIVVGAALLFCATAIATVIKNMFGYTG